MPQVHGSEVLTKHFNVQHIKIFKRKSTMTQRGKENPEKPKATKANEPITFQMSSINTVKEKIE